ncbi:phage baseplate assembly protein [Acinetobacter sp. Ac_5812]|uniref:phage baseplate assembly protein n=1 Tax=Acinetobacter sp. Ac_5812 TaxID=1848937 RepID=UPI0014905803|nr:hypothetical protein [Acinetobacter sp. Ac_5812]NNP68967.1 hypothetical protein [Acinetobacter sp. Ac_5812]
MNQDVVKLKVISGTDQLEITGWTNLSITRGIERIPNSFDLRMSEKIPDLDYIEVIEGSKCQVLIGDEVVVTGYIDRVIPIISGEQHTIQIVGRGLCQDLVDCSAVYKGMQFMNMSVESIARSLCEDFLIGVISEIEPDPISTQNINFGETSAAVIERICRIAQALYYEDEFGNLVLSRERNDVASGVLMQGVNVENATYVRGMDQRYSHYTIVYPNAQLTPDITNGISFGHYTLEDKTVPRYRPLYIIPEDGDAGFLVAEKRIFWEAKRRYARSYMLRATVTNWRDSDEKLYKPNTQIKINIPKLKLENENWLIGEVTYRIDETGTRCDLLVMPVGAFSLQPIVPYQGLPVDVLNAAGAGKQ